jgi:hypothetical protein
MGDDYHAPGNHFFEYLDTYMKYAKPLPSPERDAAQEVDSKYSRFNLDYGRLFGPLCCEEYYVFKKRDWGYVFEFKFAWDLGEREKEFCKRERTALADVEAAIDDLVELERLAVEFCVAVENCERGHLPTQKGFLISQERFESKMKERRKDFWLANLDKVRPSFNRWKEKFDAVKAKGVRIDLGFYMEVLDVFKAGEATDRIGAESKVDEYRAIRSKIIS